MPISFLSLPAEIRNSIYGFTFAGNPPPHPTDPQSKSFTPLLQICRQIRSEAFDMFYASTTFFFDLSQEDVLAGAPEASKWLSMVGDKHMRLIGGLRIHTDRFDVELEQNDADRDPRLVLRSLAIKGREVYTAVAAPQLPGAQPHAGIAMTFVPSTLPAKDDSEARASIGYALNMLFNNPDINMVPYVGHNLVGGLAQFLTLFHRRPRGQFYATVESAWHFVGGGTSLQQVGPYASDFEVVRDRE